ncbi:MAG: phosphonate C-P lyase system protein PhnH [Cyanobacteria bacterium J06649_4]
MLTVQLPGFENLTRDSQKTFRALLEALSLPGKTLEIEVTLKAPEGLTIACAAACLTLMDLETDVWLQPEISTDIRDWIQFHTGCVFVESPEKAAFAVIQNADLLYLEQFYWGSAEKPEVSTTLLVQVNELAGGMLVTLTGPGISHENIVSPKLHSHFWQQWQQNHAAYPQGIDVFLFKARSVLGLPRSTYARAEDR